MIRSIEEKDRAVFIEMAREFYSTDAVERSIPYEYHERTFKELMDSDVYAFCYMLEYNGAAAGYALMAKTFSQEAGGYVVWIDEVYVRPEYKSKGLFKGFFSYLKTNIGDKTARIRLEVESDNVRAISLYESIGFRKLDYGQMVMDLN